jgi:hypothetical protein
VGLCERLGIFVRLARRQEFTKKNASQSIYTGEVVVLLFTRLLRGEYVKSEKVSCECPEERNDIYE